MAKMSRMILIEVLQDSLILSPLNTKEECVQIFDRWMENKDKYLYKYLDYVENGEQDGSKELYLKLRRNDDK